MNNKSCTDDKWIVICIFALLVLTLGEPDILDGLIKILNKG